MEKSYVTMEQKQCPICMLVHDSGSILLDRKLRPKFEHKTHTGWGLCEDCTAKDEAGYVALIGCDPHTSVVEPNGNIRLEGAHGRTGTIAHLKREAAQQLFNIDITESKQQFVFVDPGVISMLEDMQKASEVKH